MKFPPLVGSPETEDIASMVEKSILLRREASHCKALGEKNPKFRERARYGLEATQLVNVTTYDIAKYAERARKLTGRTDLFSAELHEIGLDEGIDLAIHHTAHI